MLLHITCINSHRNLRRQYLSPRVRYSLTISESNAGFPVEILVFLISLAVMEQLALSTTVVESNLESLVVEISTHSTMLAYTPSRELSR